MERSDTSNNSGKFGIMFRSLHYRNYRLFFSGQSISLIGTWMQRIALPWLVYQTTGSVFLLGVVSFAGQIPTFFLTPVTGVLTDRWSRYRVLVTTQVASMLLAGLLALFTLTGTINIWLIVIISILLGCVNAFDVPARHSFVIDMVEKKEDLGNAIALNSLMFNGARLIGPSVAGILLAAAGEGICFLMNSVSYIFVIISLLLMHVPERQERVKETHLLTEMKEGLAYTFGFAPIKYIILLLGLVSLMTLSYQVLMPAYAKEILKGGSNTYGFLMGAVGFGALIGAVYLASREKIIMLGNIIHRSTLLLGTGLIAVSFSRITTISLVLMVFVGLGMMIHTAACNTILQTVTDDDKRGRVMSFYAMAIMGIAPFGSLLAGSLARLIGTPATIFVSGMASVAGALFFLKKLPELKEIIRPVYFRMGVIPQVAGGLQSATEPGIKHENVLLDKTDESRI
jgi:MFS family permease